MTTRQHIITLPGLHVSLHRLDDGDVFQFYVRRTWRPSLREALAAWWHGIETEVYAALTRREAARLNMAVGRRLCELGREGVRDSRDATCGG